MRVGLWRKKCLLTYTNCATLCGIALIFSCEKCIFNLRVLFFEQILVVIVGLRPFPQARVMLKELQPFYTNCYFKTVSYIGRVSNNFVGLFLSCIMK